MSDGNEEVNDLGKPLTPAERKALRDMLDQYNHSRWLFLVTMKLAKWITIITAGVVAYKQLPGLLK